MEQLAYRFRNNIRIDLRFSLNRYPTISGVFWPIAKASDISRLFESPAAAMNGFDGLVFTDDIDEERMIAINTW